MSSEEYRNCPYCDEEIKVKAIKCKHCKTLLPEEGTVMKSNMAQETKNAIGVDKDFKAETEKLRGSKPTWKRLWVWTAAVLILIVIIIAASGGDGDTIPEAATSEPEETTTAAVPEPEPEPEPDPVPSVSFISIGETTTFAEWVYKVIDVEYHKTLRDERARGIYAVFMLEATNNSNVPREIGRMFQLEDDKGRVFSFDSSASLSHHQTFRTDTWHLEDIGPSFTGIMPIVFDIAEDIETLFFYPRDIRDEEFKETSVIRVRVER